MKVEWKPVKALFALQRRAVDLQPDQEYREIGVRSFGKGLFIKEPVTGSDLGSKRVFRVCSGDLIVSNVFAWEGAVGLAGPEHDGLIGSHRFMTWTTTDPSVNTRFALQFFRSKMGVSELGKASPGSAGRNRTLSIKNFEEILVPIPSRADQDRIAAHLDSFAEPAVRAAEASARAEQFSELLRQQVLDRLAERGLTPLRAVLRPTGALEEVAPEREYSTLGVRSFGRGAFASGSTLGAETAYKKLRRFHAGQVCFPKLMAWQGALAVIPDELDGHYASPEFVGFDVDQALASSEYIGHCLGWSSLVNAGATVSTGTNANRRRLQPQDFLALSIPLPDLKAQEAVSEMLTTAALAATSARSATDVAAAILQAARNEVFLSLA